MTTYKNTTATVRAVLAALGDTDADPMAVLADAGIPRDVAMDPDGQVTLDVMRGFWQKAYAASNDPYLALHAALKATHGSYKTLDYLLFAASTAGEGIGKFTDHFRLINEWMRYDQEFSDGLYHVRLSSDIGTVPFPGVEITFSALVERTRHVVGRDWAPAAVEFMHQPIGEKAYYETYFSAPVRFGADQARISFSPSAWQTPLPTADLALFGVLSTHAKIMEGEAPKEDIIAQTRAEVLRLLSDGAPSIEEVAAALGLGARTLQRRLSEFDLTFSALVDQLRHDQARDLINGGAMSLSEIAFFLGFGDQSAFSRAFKRWEGVSPKAFRAG